MRRRPLAAHSATIVLQAGCLTVRVLDALIYARIKMGRKEVGPVQGVLPFPNTWGGPERGGGRKPKEGAGVRHLPREAVNGREPAHVTVKLRGGLPSLRTMDTDRVLRGAFEKGCERFGFRLVHYSVQRDHIHMLVEAEDGRALARGMQGLLVRVAKALNKLWRRVGSVFADRFHSRLLKTPSEVKNASPSFTIFTSSYF